MEAIAMKTLLMAVAALLLTNCATVTPEAQARSLLDRLEFAEDETGCFRLSGQIDLNPIPFMTSNVTMDLRKSKGENAPDC
jgi:hypothetical protein